MSETKTFNLMGIRPGDVGVLHNGERRRFLRFDAATDAKCPYIFEDGTGHECGRDVYGKLMPDGDPDLVHRDVVLIEPGLNAAVDLQKLIEEFVLQAPAEEPDDWRGCGNSGDERKNAVDEFHWEWAQKFRPLIAATS